jgi:sec-independent protein translocase protein TatA
LTIVLNGGSIYVRIKESQMDAYNGYILAWTIGWPELLVILVIALLIFGRRLPDLARGMGRSLTEFKKGLHDTKDEIEQEAKDIEKEVKKEPAKDSRKDQNG